MEITIMDSMAQLMELNNGSWVIKNAAFLMEHEGQEQEAAAREIGMENLAPVCSYEIFKTFKWSIKCFKQGVQ